MKKNSAILKEYFQTGTPFLGRLEKLADSLERQESIISCSLIGSVARKTYRPLKSDIDILILISGGNDENLLSLAQKHIDDLHYENGIYAGRIESTPVSIALRDYSGFIRHIGSIMAADSLEMHVQPWVVGGEIPEVLLSDVASAIILSDRYGGFREIQKTLRQGYPDKLHNDGRALLMEELRMKCMVALSHFHSGNSFLGDYGLAEVIVILSRVHYMEEKMYHPGFKHTLDDACFIRKHGLDNILFEIHDRGYEIDFLKRLGIVQK